jgi:hypothetical protein
VLYHLSQLECWAGNWDAAEQYALEGCRVAEETHQQPMRPATLYALALVRGHQGQEDRAHELADEALALCGQRGNIPVTSQLVAMLGFLALSLVTTRPRTPTWAVSPPPPLPSAWANRA